MLVEASCHGTGSKNVKICTSIKLLVNKELMDAATVKASYPD